MIKTMSLKNKNNIMKFAGIFKENEGEWKKIMTNIEKDRKNFKLREVKF